MTQSTSTRTLLSCGIAASVLYALVNVIVPLFATDYSTMNDTVSELSAIGAPTRTLWLVLVLPYGPLFALFGWGVWRAASNRWLLAAGWLLFFYGILNLYWPAMHTRQSLAAGGGTLSDTLHLVCAGTSVAMFVLILVTAAAGMDRHFRAFTA